MKAGSSKDKVHYSGMSILYILFVVMIFSSAHTFYYTFEKLGVLESFLSAFGVVFVSYALIRILFLPCRYILKDDYLYIQFGLMRKKIPYLQIKSFEKSNTILSGAGWSLSRIKIVYDEKKFKIQPVAIISPKDRDAFMRDLEQHIAEIKAQSESN